MFNTLHYLFSFLSIRLSVLGLRHFETPTSCFHYVRYSKVMNINGMSLGLVRMFSTYMSKSKGNKTLTIINNQLNTWN